MDHREYFGFTGRSRLDKSINSLLGIVEGITTDSLINSAEVGFLNIWLSEHKNVKDTHPYNELLPVVSQAASDGMISSDEKQDIQWLCEKLRSTDYYDEITADLQRLHAILGAIVSDSVISESELNGLSEWLSEHEHLKTCWPYEEVDSLKTVVLKDKKIDAAEHKLLKEFFSEFTALMDGRTITAARISERGNIVGLCAVCPEIKFEDSLFCLTGASLKYTRSEFSKIIQELGGRTINSVSEKLNYLIIGADGNPCWAYACYGRKVEKAVNLRKSGARILLVHENDFHDAVSDL
jgi:hypothetical protein